MTEEEVRANAEYMAAYLKPYGWEYIVIDIQWYEPGAYASAYRPFVPQWTDIKAREIAHPYAYYTGRRSCFIMKNIVTFNPNHYSINDKPVWLASGEMHYYKIQRDDWRRRLLQIKLAGFNTVSVYMPWNYHEVMEGNLSFGISEIGVGKASIPNPGHPGTDEVFYCMQGHVVCHIAEEKAFYEVEK